MRTRVKWAVSIIVRWSSSSAILSLVEEIWYRGYLRMLLCLSSGVLMCFLLSYAYVYALNQPSNPILSQYTVGKYMLFDGLGSARIVKNCDLRLLPEAASSRPRSQFFTKRAFQPTNNICIHINILRICYLLWRAVIRLLVKADKWCAKY